MTQRLATAPPGERERSATERLRPIAEDYPFEPRFLVHPDGIAQHFIDEGPHDAEPLLFLHGNPTWSFAWRRPIQALRDRYRCIAPDHVGCGLSDKPQDYEYLLTTHVRNLERLVLELELDRITLVLHDWGGSIGMGFARRHPDRIARLIVTNTAAFRSSLMPRRLSACRVPLLGKLAIRGLNAFARSATRMAVERPLTAGARRGYLLPYDSWRNRIATHAFVADIPLQPSHPSYDELRRVEESLADFRDRPMTILWGERDWCFSPPFREEWERRFPEARVHRLEEAGHFLFEDSPRELIRTMEGFLEEHPIR